MEFEKVGQNCILYLMHKETCRNVRETVVVDLSMPPGYDTGQGGALPPIGGDLCRVKLCIEIEHTHSHTY